VTTSFSRPEAKKNRKPLFGALTAAVVAIGGLLVFVLTRPSDTTSTYQKNACLPDTTVTCLISWSRTGSGVKAVFNRPAGREFEYSVGEKTDVVLTANWFCGIGETMAVYRPRTGVVYYFPSWPRDTSEREVMVLADPTGAIQGRVQIGERNGDGCADLGLTTTAGSVWYLPAVQRSRLVEVAVGEVG
jgi:hypothetical protein